MKKYIFLSLHLKLFSLLTRANSRDNMLAWELLLKNYFDFLCHIQYDQGVLIHYPVLRSLIYAIVNIHGTCSDIQREDVEQQG